MYGQDFIVIIWKVAFEIPWIAYLFKLSADMVMYVWLSCNHNNIVIQAKMNERWMIYYRLVQSQHDDVIKWKHFPR